MTRRRFRLLLVLGLMFSVVPALAAPAAATTGDVVITGVIDGPLTGGVPKAIEVFAVNDVADMSVYGLGAANNGGGSDGEEFTFPAVAASAGQFIYVATESVEFTNFFGFAPDYISGSAASVNGDDAIELFMNGAVVDVFGDINTDGTGQAWEYLDGWAYRVDDTGADGTTFVLGNWIFSGPNALDGETTNATAAIPFPIGTYAASPPTPNLLINEVDADQVSTDSAEFVEIYDGGVGNTDLSGLVLVLFNGSDDASYNAFDLDGQSTGADGYFVLCGNAATVANCDLDVSPDTNLIQNGADAVALFTGDAADFPNDTPVTTTDLIDAIVYDTSDGDDPGLLPLLNAGEPQVNEGGNGNPTGESNQRCPNGSGGARNTSTYAQFPPTSGAVNDCVAPPAMAKIHDVQGSGDVSPLVGQTVTIEGIVVGDFQEIVTNDPSDEPLEGFFVQEEDSDIDTDPSTSEGIFVFAPGAIDVQVGDHVEVTGSVSEFFGLTEIAFPSNVAVVSSGNPLPTPAAPILPTSVGDPVLDWEAIEGMSASFDQTLYVTGMFPLGAFGEVQLSAIGPQDHPNQTNAVGSQAAMDQRQLNLDSRVILDDGEEENENSPSGISTWNPDPTPYLQQPEGTLRSGDAVNDLFAVVHYRFGEYEVHPINIADPTDPDGAVDIDRIEARPAVPQVGGHLQVASFNVLNYFTTIDNGQPICGPPGFEQRCRGADTAQEFADQAAKIVDAIVDLDADVVGLIEIENNAGVATADLVSRLNSDAGATRTYDYVDTGFIGTDAIAVAFIYDTATVEPVGDFAVLDSSVSPAFVDDKNRPALAQTFEDLATRGTMTVAVNHLKSKGSDCLDVANPGDPAFGVAGYPAGADIDDPNFQGNCNLTRTAAAQVLGQWLASDPTGTGSANLMVLGDLNAYANEDPVTALEAQGYSNLNRLFNGTSWAAGGHTFVFDGELGSLDYAMANADMLGQVTGAAAWHINADEPFAIDYQNFNPPGQYTPDEFKSSDHDPVVVGLALETPAGLTCNGLPATIVGSGIISGTNDDDVIVALGGDDVINGLNGDDTICAGAGADVVDGGNGDDVIFGEQGADTIAGGRGADTIFGDKGDDSLFGDRGDDLLDGGAGDDDGDGGNGFDTCVAVETAVNCEA